MTTQHLVHPGVPAEVLRPGALPAQDEDHRLGLLEDEGEARARRGEAHRELQVILLLCR